MIYKSFILPIIEYRNVIYQTANKQILEKIQRVQNQALKLCLALVHKSANINTLGERREKATIKFMFTRTKKEIFLDQKEYKIERQSTTLPKLNIPSYKSSLAKKALSYSG